MHEEYVIEKEFDHLEREHTIEDFLLIRPLHLDPELEEYIGDEHSNTHGG